MSKETATRKVPPEAAAVIAFWEAAGPALWFTRDADFDAAIARTFGQLHAHAANGGCDIWSETAEGALALILLLDQFSRNLYRNDPRAFGQDSRARGIARTAIDRGFDEDIDGPLRHFFYMPFMHAEDPNAQALCVELFAALGDDDTLKHAQEHRDIISRFGRFPHRNHVLGRKMTPDEQAFLDDGGFSG